MSQARLGERDRGSPNITHAMETLEMQKKMAMSLFIAQIAEEEQQEEEETSDTSLESLLMLMQGVELEESLLVFHALFTRVIRVRVHMFTKVCLHLHQHFF